MHASTVEHAKSVKRTLFDENHSFAGLVVPKTVRQEEASAGSLSFTSSWSMWGIMPVPGAGSCTKG